MKNLLIFVFFLITTTGFTQSKTVLVGHNFKFDSISIKGVVVDSIIPASSFTGNLSNSITLADTIFVNTVILSGYIRHHDIMASSAILGPTAPSAVTIGTFRGLGFDADAEQAFFAPEVPTDWNETSDMALVVHWFPTSGDAVANGETVKWDISYRSIAEGEAVDRGTAVTITATFTGGASETDKEHYETILIIDFDNADQPLSVDDDIGFQFDRDKTGDTYSGAGIVYKWDLVYTSNTIPRGD